MGHVTRDNGRGVVDINTTTGQILVRQKWMYQWIAGPKLPPWTYKEQHDYHRRVDLAVWAVWSNRARLAVSGTSDFAKRFAKTGAPVNMDAQWVKSGQHWTVFVTKVPDGVFYPSQVFWNSKRIQLGSRDYAPVTRVIDGKTRKQRTGPHEFGHAFGNTGVLKRGDEYPKPNAKPSPHVADDQSIMHVGEQLRVRHFQTLIEELNQMIPDTKFKVASLK